ncbi:hypothetical protein M9Y10_042715 [Tritrichomonas musculus]|uniref:Uncharacterized protein n=1 Tax=Tritrichomonas musculus TaxID=1915356 RepID=A0ABR2JXM8_9EUKA
MKKELKSTKRKDCKYKFQSIWELISRDSENKNQKNNISYSNNIQIDYYFRETPIFQQYLTENNMIFDSNVDFSNYNKLLPNQISKPNLSDFFQGILFYIYYNSDNKFNLNELEFHFSGGSRRDNLSTIIEHSTNQNPADQLDILNIFNYENINKQFRVETIKYAFFGVTFKNIKINVTSYSIRSGPLQANVSHLVSFTFEGYDEDKQKWDILDERANINDLIPTGSFQMFYVRTSNKFYSSFKIKQTEPGSNGYWGFSIAAFEIHGGISLVDKSFVSMNDCYSEKKEDTTNFFQFDSFDPTMDITEYL